MELEYLQNSFQADVAQCSDRGKKNDNEDAIGIRIPTGLPAITKGMVAVIADGVSAAEGGKEAAQTAVTGFLNDYYSTPDTWSVQQSGVKVISALNHWLYGHSHRFMDTEKGWVTTFSAVVIKAGIAYVFHVGDSRIYLYRNGELEQLTRDHAVTVAHGHRYLSRALGIASSLEIDFRKVSIQADDLLLTMTDGVSDFLPHPLLLKALTDTRHLDTLCQTMVDQALAHGSDDNLSVQAIRINQPGQLPAEEAIQALYTLPFPPDLEPGQSLDGWKVLKLIKASSRSQIYLVENAEQQKAVMKTPSVNFADDPGYRERFLMEEWIGKRIHSPYVVKTVTPEKRTWLYYLTEYVAGPTLQQLLQERGSLAITEAIDIGKQVASGLRAFHRRETLHQDIKPDNIVYGRNGIKIIDFGSALVAGVDEIATTIERETALGTLDYSAPEYRLKNRRSPRSDQFSLALLIYELLTGQHPYGSDYGKAQSMAQFQKLRYTAAFVHNPLVPVWLDGALKKALSLNSELRYPALSEFTHDLQYPNPHYLKDVHLPLALRNPKLTIRILLGLSLVLNILLLYLLLT